MNYGDTVWMIQRRGESGRPLEPQPGDAGTIYAVEAEADKALAALPEDVRGLFGKFAYTVQRSPR